MAKNEKKLLKKDEFNQNKSTQDLLSLYRSLSPEDQQTIQTIIGYKEVHRSYNGPLPAPEDFQQYENVLPGAADRIITMAEKQLTHRTGIEKEIVDKNFKQSATGQIIGGFLAFTCIVLSFILGMYGHDWLAGLLATTTVIGVITVFVLNRKPGQENDDSTNEDEKE